VTSSRGSASPARGITFSLLGGALLTSNDAVLKWLTGDYPVGQLLFFRGLFVLAAISLIVWRSGGIDVIRINSYWGQAQRAGFALARYLDRETNPQEEARLRTEVKKLYQSALPLTETCVPEHRLTRDLCRFWISSDIL